jgi:hypothetical protein
VPWRYLDERTATHAHCRTPLVEGTASDAGRGDRAAERHRERLEHGFEHVVGVLTREVVDVQRDARVGDE